MIPVAQSEIESVTDDCFHDQVIGRASQSDAQAEIDLPLRRQVQIDCGKDLLLLLMDRQKVGGRSEGTVIFQSAGDFWREVVAEFEIWRKHETLILAQAVDRIIKSGIESPIPAADFL